MVANIPEHAVEQAQQQLEHAQTSHQVVSDLGGVRAPGKIEQIPGPCDARVAESDANAKGCSRPAMEGVKHFRLNKQWGGTI